MTPTLLILAAIATAGGGWIILSPRRSAFALGLVIATNASAVLTREFGSPPFILPLSLAVVGIGVLRALRSVGGPDAPSGHGGWLPAAAFTSIAAIVLSAALGPFVSVAPSSSQAAVALVLQNLLVVAAVCAVAMHERSLRSILAGLLTGGFAMSLVTNVQALTGTREWAAFGFSAWSREVIGGAGDTFRAAGPFIGDANAYARALVVFTGIAIGLVIDSRSRIPRWQRWSLLAAATSMTFGLLHTSSRTGLLGIAVVAAAALTLGGLNRRRVAVVAIAGLIVVLSPVGVGSRLATLGTSPTAQEADSGLRGRASEMIAAAQMFTDHPVFGVGFGTYNDRYLDYSRPLGIDPRFELRSAHSLPLEIAAEQGLVGLTAWASLVAVAGVVIVRLRRRSADLGNSLGLAALGFAATSVFLHDVHPQLMWMLVGMVLGAAILVDRADRRSAGSVASEPLRVAMVIQSYVPAVGGAERQLANLMPYLVDAGVEPIVITRSMAGRPRDDEIDGVPVVRLPVRGPKIVQSLLFVAQARAVLARFDPLVVHAFDSLTPSSIALGHRAATGTPFVTKILRSGELGDLHRLRAKPFGVHRLGRLLRDADAIVAISADIERELAAHGVPGDRIARIPNGVDCERFRPSGRATRSVVGEAPVKVVATGRLAPEKRLVEVASRWHQVTHRWPGARLVLVGDGPESEHLRGVDGVELLGRRCDVDEILRDADVYISASRAEGLSNSLLEAMATGLPCVVTDVGGVRDVIRESAEGVVVAPDDLDGLVAALVDLIGDRDRRQSMGSAARRRIRTQYGLDETARRLVDLYSDLARPPVPAGWPQPTIDHLPEAVLR